MSPIEALKERLMTSNYRHVLDECGRPVAPSSDVYQELSDWLEKCPMKTTSSSVGYDKALKKSNDGTDINFDIRIPLKTWHDIDCEKVIYQSKDKVQRNYSTLRRKRWTTTIYALIREKKKLPCAFMFKRCSISGTGIHMTIDAKCSDCKASFKRIIANQPPKNSAVRLECCVSRFNPSVKHVTKRPLTKHAMLKNSSGAMRADKFVARHLRSSESRAKTAVASQDWAMADESSATVASAGVIMIPLDTTVENNPNIIRANPTADLPPTPPESIPCDIDQKVVGLLKNGNTCPSLLDKGTRIVVRNTCGPDSLTSVLAGACGSYRFKEEISKSNSAFMLFLRNFLKNGSSAEIYTERALLLKNVSQFDSNFKNNICSKKTVRRSIIVPINVEVIENQGMMRLAAATEDDMPSREAICCGQKIKRNLIYGSQIIIECDPAAIRLAKKCKLEDFPKRLRLLGKSFSFAGVVVRYGGCDKRSSHYVGYSYQGTKWVEFNDTKKKNWNQVRCICA